jgi:hypothetical protein
MISKGRFGEYLFNGLSISSMFYTFCFIGSHWSFRTNDLLPARLCFAISAFSRRQGKHRNGATEKSLLRSAGYLGVEMARKYHFATNGKIFVSYLACGCGWILLPLKHLCSWIGDGNADGVGACVRGCGR